MTPGPRIAVFSLLITVSACEIQRDVPGFTYPPSTLDETAAAPVLQPTGDLIVDASADERTYRETIAQMDGRAYRLRRAVADPDR